MKIIDGWVDSAIEVGYVHKSMSRSGHKITHLVIHGTAGGSSAQNVGAYFQTSTVDSSAHIIIGRDGAIVQGVPLTHAAWANGALTTGHAPYLSGNPNLYTVSIEFVKPSTDNSDALTEVQAQRGFELIQCLCDTYGVPKRAGDLSGGVISHADIDPVNRSRCPGPYPWGQLWAFLKEGNTMGIPQGWADDGTTLTVKGKKVVRGFRERILQGWDPQNVPLEEERGIENGTRQTFRDCRLLWTPERGVHMDDIGNELLGSESKIIELEKQIATLKSKAPSDEFTVAAKVLFEDIRAIIKLGELRGWVK